MKTIRLISIIFIFLFLVGAATLYSQDSGKIRDAYDLFNRGEYEKAAKIFAAAVQNSATAFEAETGLVRVWLATGDYTKAENWASRVLKTASGNAEALNLQGEIAWLHGDYAAARSSFQKAMEVNPEHLPARLNYGIMQWQWGEKQAARRTLQYFITYYRSRSNLSARELDFIARACVYLERFYDARNVFYEATDVDKTYWPAYLHLGDLFVSKYNTADAFEVYEKALKINPNAARAHLGLAKCWRRVDMEKAKMSAELALKINPNLIAALDLLAEFEILMGNFETALEKLQNQLKINPHALSTRSLRAVCFYFLKEDSKFSEETSRILTINPNYGDLYYQVAEILARRYLFQESVEFYRKALALDPEHWSAYSGLGTSLSRLGREKEGKLALERAFAKDPFNKYVGNLLQLFDEFPDYQSHTTDHFIVRMHKRDDAVLSKYAIALAQESYADLSHKYPTPGAEPFLLEIFPEHDDFAVRCFGLPGSDAFLGICFGNVVAMDSPRARSKGDFVWGETLWHELVHVSHLRLTDNRIPRWLAEGIAVYETATAKPHWSMPLDLPFIQAFLSNQLLPLKELDSGFNRPTKPGQVSLSYFQASKVVEFLVEKYGHSRLTQTFPEFKAGLTTGQVFYKVYKKDLDALNEEFKSFIKQAYRMDEVDYSFDPRQLKAHAADRETYLKEQLEKKPNNPFLNFMLGRYYKENDQMKLAIQYLRKAKTLFPQYIHESNPYSELAELYLKNHQKQEAITELKSLTALNGKNTQALTKLAELCIEVNNHSDAIVALNKIIYNTPFDSEVHKMLASAYLAEKRYDEAIDELQILLVTQPQDMAGAHCDLAEAYLKAGRKSEAKKSALSALEIAPNFEKAQNILLECVE